MRSFRNLLARCLTVFLLFVLPAVFSQAPGPAVPVSNSPRPFQNNVRTILLLTSYPVADIVTSNFFDSFRKGIRELNLPIDCHVVELNASQKGNEDRVDNTFARLERALNDGLYSIVVTLNHEAADVVMRNYDRFPRSVPVLFAGLGRVPEELKRLYPNSTAISIADDTLGTVELGLKLFPEAQNLMLVVDDTTISEETRNDILARCKLHYPQLDYKWINSMDDKREIQKTINTFPDESMVLFFPSHDYANGHNETLMAFVQNIGFDTRFPCLALDDTLFGNGAVGGNVIETHKLGREAARMAAQILNAGSAQRIAEKSILPKRMVDYAKFKSYNQFSGRIPLGTTVINKPENMWTRHWQTFLTVFAIVLALVILQIFYFSWIRRRLRLNRNMLYSLPGRVMVLNRAETILFASWVKDDQKKTAPKKLEHLVGIDYPKLSKTVHDVFQTGKRITIEYNYEDVHRAISFAPIERDIFGQDAVICFSLDNTELQYARRQAEKYSAQLKKNTRMWDILINFLPIHIFAKDIDDDFRYVFNNRTRCMFYGVGENELNDKTDFDFLPRELAERLRKNDLEFVAHPESPQQESNVDVKTWDGSVQHLRSIQRIFTDEDGTRLLLGTAVNITELEEAHLQMQQLNSKLQELLQQHSILLDNMPSIVMTKDIDDDFRFISCNDAFLKFFDLPASSVIGKTDFEIPHIRKADAIAVHTDDVHAVEVLEHRPEYHSTGQVYDYRGRIRIGKFYRKLIRTADNRRILFTLFHDVTDIENAKREAEESADRFLLTLRSIGDGVITTDSQGIVTLINPNAEKMLGCKQADALNRPHTDFFRIVHEQTGRPVPSPLMDALRSGEIAMGEDQTDLVSASGRRYHIAASAAPIRTRSGEITGAILVFRDVTEEINKREELRLTMQELENASEMARLASFRYDFNTRKRTGSNLINELWPEDENGNALLEEQWVYPEDIPIFKQNVNDLMEKRSESVQFSFRVSSPDNDGDFRYYRMKLMRDRRNPKAPAVSGIVQDVTEITQNMLKLKDTQALWDVAINSIPIMFTVKDIDDDFRYLLCNKAFANFFKFSPDEIVGKMDHDLFHDDTTLGFADQVNFPSTGTDGIMEIEGELPDGNGNLRYIKTLMRGFQDARGHRLLLAAGNDVTDMHSLIKNQKAVNDLLEDILGEEDFDLCIQRTLENVSRILGASRGCLIRHEEDGAKAHCVAEYVNPDHKNARIKMFGRTLNSVRGILEHTDDKRTFVCSDMSTLDMSIIPDDWRQAAIALDLRAIFLSNIVCEGAVRGTVGFNFEGFDHTFTDNDVALLSATAHMIEVVLARKRAKAIIMDALSRAQAADKAKSFFIASVSHEIRTPLNSVIGFAELLREGGVSQKQEREYLDAISSSANALLMLINDVLDLSKLEANQMKIITAFTDFNALCREVLLIFTFRAKENSNKLVSDVPDDFPEVEIDNIRIRQIVINLLGNAVKFTKKGTITLHATFTPDPDSADTGTLRCSVSDTGIGISEEDQKKLMEPFVQLSRMRGTNAVNNGTGLGLSISKRLATCMNGELTCTSHVGEGSTFTVTLNAVRYRAKAASAKPSAAKSAAASISRDVKSICILIVDDVPMNLRVAKALFKKIGFSNVLIASSGKEALETLEKQPVDLILSDMWMPEMNGAQLSAAVKKDPRFSHISIVAQTADVETSGNFDMSHFDAIILKPLTGEKLLNMINRIVANGDGQNDNAQDGPINLG